MAHREAWPQAPCSGQAPISCDGSGSLNTFTKCPGNRVRFKVSQNRAAAGGLGHEGQARQPTQSLAVEGVVRPPRLDPLIEDAELPPSDGREEVAQPVVVADVRVLVVRRRVPGLRRQKARLL